MRLPNGFGTIYLLSNAEHRRRPWVAKITKDGKQKPLGYFRTYQEALAFLVDYNKEPGLYGPDITFEQVFEAFRNEHWARITDTARKGYENSYRHCFKLHRKPFRKLKLADLQKVVSECGAGYSTQKKIRTLLHMMYKFAIKNDLADRNYSLYVTVCKDDKRREKVPFTVRQIRRLARLHTEDSELILMLIYVGLRPSEFLRLRAADITARKRYLIVKKSKTAAGKNRVVPIHPCVWPLYEKRLAQGSGKLCELSVSQFRSRFNALMDTLHMQHQPYECRHTFASLLDSAGANATAIKRLMGHASQDVLGKFYTHKRLGELRKTVQLLPACE